MSRLQARQIEHGGITTEYYDEGEGPVLLLLHGFTGSKLDFHDQLQWFTDRYRVVVPDNRGHGGSSNTGEAGHYTLPQLVSDLASFIKAMDLRDIHLLGHSLGGMIVMRYALDNQERLASLILMDTASGPFERRVELEAFIDKAVEAGGPMALLDLQKNAPKVPEVQSGIDYLGEEEHWARIEEKLAQMDPVAYLTISTTLRDMQDVTADLASIQVPSTVMVGVADGPFVEASTKMSEMLPNAELEVIEAAAHCPQYENASAWRDVMERHLTRAG